MTVTLQGRSQRTSSTKPTTCIPFPYSFPFRSITVTLLPSIAFLDINPVSEGHTQIIPKCTSSLSASRQAQMKY